MFLVAKMDNVCLYLASVFVILDGLEPHVQSPVGALILLNCVLFSSAVAQNVIHYLSPFPSLLSFFTQLGVFLAA